MLPESQAPAQPATRSSAASDVYKRQRQAYLLHLGHVGRGVEHLGGEDPAPRGRRRPAPASRPCPAAAWRPPNAGGSRRCPPVPETAEQESYPAVHSISSSLTGKMTDLRGIVLVKVVSVAGLKLLFVDFALRQRYVSSMLLRVEQAARRLGVSPVTIRRGTATGFLPCTRTAGGHRRIDEHDIDCLLYTSDAADDLLCVDLGGRRIIKKKK